MRCRCLNPSKHFLFYPARIGTQVKRSCTAGDEGLQPSITGGKYLTKDIYLELETDPSGVSDRVKLEVDVTNNIAVESKLTSETGSNTGVKWH